MKFKILLGRVIKFERLKVIYAQIRLVLSEPDTNMSGQNLFCADMHVRSCLNSVHLLESPIKCFSLDIGKLE